jgi:hypothetical protein
MPISYNIIGLLILLTIIVLYYRACHSKQYCSNTTYYDSLYYELPKLQAKADQIANHNKPGSLNDQPTVLRTPPVVASETNQQASRWAGSSNNQDAAAQQAALNA